MPQAKTLSPKGVPNFEQGKRGSAPKALEDKDPPRCNIRISEKVPRTSDGFLVKTIGYMRPL